MFRSLYISRILFAIYIKVMIKIILYISSCCFRIRLYFFKNFFGEKYKFFIFIRSFLSLNILIWLVSICVLKMMVSYPYNDCWSSTSSLSSCSSSPSSSSSSKSFSSSSSLITYYLCGESSKEGSYWVIDALGLGPLFFFSLAGSSMRPMLLRIRCLIWNSASYLSCCAVVAPFK